MSAQPPKKGGGPPQPPPKDRWKQQQPAPKPQPKPQPKAQPQKAKAPAKPAAPLQLAAPKGSKEIHFACPACGRPFAMPGRRVGRKARCSCGARMIIPTPGGVPRPLWMPAEEVRKKAAQQWQTSDSEGKNATEIALETSPTKMAMYAGVVIAAVVGYFIWKNKQDAVHLPTGPSTPITTGTPDAPKDLAPGELAGVCRQSVFSVEALDATGVVISKGPGYLATPGVVATSLSNVLGASTVRFRSADGAVWQSPSLIGTDDVLDLALFEVQGIGRAPIIADEAAITDPGTAAWVGWSSKDPAAAAFAKSPGLPAVLRLSKSFPAGAPVLSAKGKILAMVIATPGGQTDAVPAKTIATMAEKKPGQPIVEGLSIAPGGPHRGDERLVGRLVAAGRSALAIRMLEAMVAGGGAGDALLWLGEALLTERRPHAAALRFAEAAKAKESWAARRGEGLALLETGDVPGAVAAFRAAAAAGGSSDALTLAGLALALARAGDPARAVLAAESALNAKDPDRRALFCAAVAGATTKNGSVEKKALEALENIKPGEAEIFMARGECALARGDAAAAEKAFTSAKDANGGSRALAARGRALEALGQRDAAKDAFVSAMDANGTDEEACFAAARALDAAGKRDPALAALAGLLAADPAHAAANAEAGRILLATDPAKALPRLEQAVKSDPDSAESAQWLARAQVATGDHSAGEATLTAFLASHPDDDVRIALALLQVESAPEKSLVTLAGVRATAGVVAARAAHARGTAHLALDKDLEARGDWEMAISLDPSSGLYRFQRGIAGESGDLHESRALWEAYLAWARKNADDPARVQAAERKLLERFGR